MGDEKQGTYTDKYTLYQPKEGEVGWGNDVNDNFEKIDKALGIGSSGQSPLRPANDRQILRYSLVNKEWIHEDLTLRALDDVNLKNYIKNGDILQYDGITQRWVNVPVTDTGSDGPTPGVSWFDINNPRAGDILQYAAGTPYGKFINIVNPAFLKDGSSKMEGDLNMNFHMLTNVNTVVGVGDLVTKQYVDSRVGSIDWQDSVLNFYDPSSALPSSPTSGDRYISTGTNTSVTPQWHPNRIYHYTAETGWTSIYINKGCACYIEMEESLFIFDGTVWSKIKGSTDSMAWQGPVLSFIDPSVTLPTSPAIGDRYIATKTASWTKNHIYEFTQKGWVDYTPTEGWLIYSKADHDLFLFNGSDWVTMFHSYEWLLDFDWLQPVDRFYNASAGIPTSPAIGNRYICNLAGHGWKYGYIYTYDGAWQERAPRKGFTAYVLELDQLYSYEGTTWQKTNVNQGSDWQSSVINFFDPTDGLPENPVLHARYISTGINLSSEPNWQVNYIYEYLGSSGWEMTITNNGCSCYVEERDCIYVLNTDNGQWLPLTIGGESQYVHRTLHNVITARHTFNPIPEVDPETGAVIATPFTIGENVAATAQRYTVLGLNAEFFDGYRSAILFQGDDVSPETRGEGVNADMVDGKHADYFASSNHSHTGYVLSETPSEVFTPASITAKLVKQAQNNLSPPYGLGHTSGIPSDTLDGLHADAFVKYTDHLSHHSFIDTATGDDHTQYLHITGGQNGDRNKLFCDLNMQEHRIQNVADPVDQLDGTNKLYVDYRIQGLEWKKEVLDIVTECPKPAEWFGGYRCIIRENQPQYTSDGDLNIFYTHSNQVAQYDSINGWRYETPSLMWAMYVYNIDRQYTFNGSIWCMFGGTQIHYNLRSLTHDDHPQYLRIDLSDRARMFCDLNMEEEDGTRHMIMNVADPGYYPDAVDGGYNHHVVSRDWVEHIGWIKPVKSIISGDIFRSVDAATKLLHKGERYLVGSVINGQCSESNAWRADPSKAERIAEFDGQQWHWYNPAEGYCVYVEDIDTYLRIDGLWLGTAIIIGSIDPANVIRIWQGGRWSPLEQTFSHNQLKGLSVGDVHTQYMRTDGTRHDTTARHYFGTEHNDGSIPHDHIRWLKDVDIGTEENGDALSDGQMLAWSATKGRWINIAPAGGAQFHQQLTDRLIDTAHNQYIRTSQTQIVNGYHEVVPGAALDFDTRWGQLHSSAAHSFANIPHDYLKNLKDVESSFPDPNTLTAKGHGMALVWDALKLNKAGLQGAWTVKLPTLSPPYHNDSLDRDLKCNHPQYFDYDRHRMSVFKEYIDCTHPDPQYTPPSVTSLDWVHQIPVNGSKLWPGDILSSRASGTDGNIPHDFLRQLNDVQFDLSTGSEGLNNGHVLMYECDYANPAQGRWTNKLIPGLSTNHNTAFSASNRSQPNCHPQYITTVAHSTGHHYWNDANAAGGPYDMTCAHNYGLGGNLPYPDINYLINTKIGAESGGKTLEQGDIMVYMGGKWVNSSTLPPVGVYHHGLIEPDLHDDHLQYMSVSVDRTVAAIHTFNPITSAAENPPFRIGPNAHKQLVVGLNSQFLNGYISEDFSLTGHTHKILEGTDSEQDYEPVPGMVLQYIKKVGEAQGKWRPRLMVTDIGLENLEGVNVTGLTGRGQILYYTGSFWTYLQPPSDRTIMQYLAIGEAGIPQWAEGSGGSGGTGVTTLKALQDVVGLNDAPPSGPTVGGLLYCSVVDTDNGTTTRQWTHLSPQPSDTGKVLTYKYSAETGARLEWANNKPIMKLADLSDMPGDMNSPISGVPIGSMLYCASINLTTNVRTWDTLDPAVTDNYCLVTKTVSGEKTPQWVDPNSLVTIIDGGTP